MTSYRLSTPIVVGKEEIEELTFGPVTPKLIDELGFPYKIALTDGQPIPTPVPSICRRYLAKLASVPPSTFEKMTPMDYTNLCWMVIGFFDQSSASPEKSSGERASISPTTGE